ncbi:MAG: hypothetical protein OWP43_09630 [Sphaerochaetaceae bacterium]|nr:hypothetical protein [Sphaerochaetaceae bacterium]
MSKKIILLVSLLLVSTYIFADNNSNTNNQNVVVNVNLNEELKSTLIPEGVELQAKSTTSLSLGVFDPIIGNCTNVLIDGEVYTQKVTGINVCLGYTWKNYFGDGLPLNKVGGCAYYSLGTLALIVPMANIGYDYRFSESFVMGLSLLGLTATFSM